MNKLTIEECEQIAKESHFSPCPYLREVMAKQLAQTMCENERLRERLLECADFLEYTGNKGSVLKEARKALSNKDSEHGN